MMVWLRRWWWAVAAAIVVVGVGTWLVWPSAPAPRARQYKAFTACLLTDTQGVAGSQAVPVWSGMQQASLATRAKVEYLPVIGPATVANARPFLAGLLQRHCGVVIGVGPIQAAAVEASAPTATDVRFGGVGRVCALLAWY
jgi:hypothetical protein